MFLNTSGMLNTQLTKYKSDKLQKICFILTNQSGLKTNKLSGKKHQLENLHSKGILSKANKLSCRSHDSFQG